MWGFWRFDVTWRCDCESRVQINDELNVRGHKKTNLLIGLSIRSDPPRHIICRWTWIISIFIGVGGSWCMKHSHSSHQNGIWWTILLAFVSFWVQRKDKFGILVPSWFGRRSFFPYVNAFKTLPRLLLAMIGSNYLSFWCTKIEYI
jgi:hypothetical protein